MDAQDKLIDSARCIARALFETEAAIENGLINSNSLLLQITKAHSDVKPTVFHGQDALESLTDLMGILAQARRKAGELHKNLSGLQSDFGLGGIAFGPVGKPVERTARASADALRAA